MLSHHTTGRWLLGDHDYRPSLPRFARSSIATSGCTRQWSVRTTMRRLLSTPRSGGRGVSCLTPSMFRRIDDRDPCAASIEHQNRISGQRDEAIDSSELVRATTPATDRSEKPPVRCEHREDARVRNRSDDVPSAAVDDGTALLYEPGRLRGHSERHHFGEHDSALVIAGARSRFAATGNAGDRRRREAQDVSGGLDTSHYDSLGRSISRNRHPRHRHLRSLHRYRLRCSHCYRHLPTSFQSSPSHRHACGIERGCSTTHYV